MAAKLAARATAALGRALAAARPDIGLDEKGYAPTIEANLVPGVRLDDFEADLREGDGNELEGKFKAAHSSSALAVNCFAPFKRSLGDLRLSWGNSFRSLQFERKCPTGLRGGRAPNLDVLLEGDGIVIGIESKCTEYLHPKEPIFSPAYAEQIRDGRREGPWFAEMQRLTRDSPNPTHLDIAQLIKHAFGLARTFPDRRVLLLYLFWEPENWREFPEFSAHRRDIAALSERVTGGIPEFIALSYADLWNSWTADGPFWLADHLRHLQQRYAVQV